MRSLGVPRNGWASCGFLDRGQRGEEVIDISVSDFLYITR